MPEDYNNKTHQTPSKLSFEKCTNKGNIASKEASAAIYTGAFLAHKNIHETTVNVTFTFGADCADAGSITKANRNGVITKK